MGTTRRVAERMIVERAERAQRISRDLHDIAARLEGDGAATDRLGLKLEADQLRALADQVQRL